MEESWLFMIVTMKIKGMMGVYGWISVSALFILSYADKLSVKGFLYAIIYGKVLAEVSV